MNIKEMIDENELNDNVSRETIYQEGSKRDVGGIFRTPSLDKPIEEYMNHPLNKSNDEDLAQGLRGLDAFIGNTNLAVIDLLGFVKYLFKKMPKKEVAEDA